MLKNLVYNEMVHDALKGSSLPDKQKQQLERMMQEKHPEEQRTIMKWIQKYTEGYQCKAGGKTPMGSIIRGLLTSPDYSLKDFKAMVFNGTLKNGSLMKELMEIDLSDTLQHITIPYLILQGNTDLVTPTKIMQLYIADSANKNLRLHLVANSGYMPSASDMDAIMKMGLDFLLAV
ncbi:alpha/beta hydrolase [Ruminococcus sp.]|uniref:alpha/beta fold hydrolase n=1 Tax=Ruminococcus sp. TaxID=41978 RepID=UPI0025E47E67|nr:alpha/beta hydrolase [Ruminococcus sp.]